MLIEAARHDTSSEELNTLLCGTTLNKTLIDKFCELYANHKGALQESLESIGNGLPHIIDVNWQLDYCIKVFIFRIIFELQSDTNITFSCHENCSLI